MGPAIPPSKTVGRKSASVSYVDRLSARVVVENDNNEIILLYIKNGNYHKLPGGGIEAGEDHVAAAQREVMEEAGCEVDVSGTCFAAVEEWRDHLHQISYCYAARLVQDTGAAALTDEEKEDGLQHKWVMIETALQELKDIQPTTNLGKSIKERDIFVLEAYIKAYK